MTKVKILVEGYARETKDAEYTTSTTTLISDNGTNIIVDPGMDNAKLLKALKKEKLSPKNIHYIALTHHHPDHVLLTALFEKAKVIDFASIFQFNGKIVGHNGQIPKTNIKVIKTPGHDPFHMSLLAQDEKLGNVLITGDLFWWFDDKLQKTDIKSLLEHNDPYAQDLIELQKSCEKILKLADYIIPGHGKMFKVIK